MPPNTVMLSQMMRELSRTARVHRAAARLSRQGPEERRSVLTPELFDTFRKLVLGRDWSGLDRFPGWTIHRVTRTIDLGQSLLENKSDHGIRGFAG